MLACVWFGATHARQEGASAEPEQAIVPLPGDESGGAISWWLDFAMPMTRKSLDGYACGPIPPPLPANVKGIPAAIRKVQEEKGLKVEKAKRAKTKKGEEKPTKAREPF